MEVPCSVTSDYNQKKRKLSNLNENISKTKKNAFENMRVVKILREDVRNKLVTILGRFADAEEDAVLLLEKKPFDKNSIAETLIASDSTTVETLKNDIYSTHDVFFSRTLPDCQATMIFPATGHHINKYSEQSCFVVRETPEFYAEITLPCLKTNKFSTEWVNNILEKKRETDRILFEDPDPETGFILVPDMKWNRTDLESLYLVAIIHKRNIGSIRDLTAEHLPLLRNILNKGKVTIHNLFNISFSKLRIFLHYQPSYRHLHVHFTHINFDAPGSDCLRAHLLEDVIESLEMDEDFFRKKTLMYTVRESDPLYNAYRMAGYFEEKAPYL